MAVSWLINGGDPNYLLNGMILQVWLGDVFAFPFGSTCHPISGTMGTWTPKIMAIVNQPPPKRHVPPSQIHKGFIAGLIKGNQWLIGPDHKAGYFWGGVRGPGGHWNKKQTTKSWICCLALRCGWKKWTKHIRTKMVVFWCSLRTMEGWMNLYDAVKIASFEGPMILRVQSFQILEISRMDTQNDDFLEKVTQK